MIYRVIIKVGYCRATFDFDSPMEASNFASIMLEHRVPDEDLKERPSKIELEIIDPALAEENNKEEE